MRHTNIRLARPGGPAVTGFLGLTVTAIVGLALPAGAQQPQDGALTFRDEQGQLVRQHTYPIGCYNVPATGWAITDLEGPAILFDHRNCLGEAIGEIGQPTAVTDGQSVLVPG